ncbi:hypothetical protein R83H12_01719 [Fibrobacteria bacterium R8-3-H12]
MLWDKRKELNVSRIFAIIIPFVIVGSILALYNYVRFDSPFQFGDAYMITDANQIVLNKISIIGKIHSFIKTFLFVLFNPPNLDLTFPFIKVKLSNIPLAKSSFMYDKEVIAGIFCFPVLWFLFYVSKINILRNFIFAGIFISLLNIATFAFTGGIVWRYILDFAWIMAIGALICVFQLQENCLAMRKAIFKIFYSCCILTLLLAFFFTISYRISFGNSTGSILDPRIPHYLARTFGVINNVP